MASPCLGIQEMLKENNKNINLLLLGTLCAWDGAYEAISSPLESSIPACQGLKCQNKNLKVSRSSPNGE